MSIEDPFGDVLSFPPVGFSFFLVTGRDATAFAVADFMGAQITKVIIARPGMADRSNATVVGMVLEDGPSNKSTWKKYFLKQKAAASNNPSFQ